MLARVSVLVVNAGLGGSSGNCQVVAEHAVRWLSEHAAPNELLVLGDSDSQRAADWSRELKTLGKTGSVSQASVDHGSVELF